MNTFKVKRLNFAVKEEIKILSAKCLWFWSNYYGFYGNILGVEAKKLEILYPRNLNKYIITEKIFEEQIKDNGDLIDKLLSEFFNLKEPLGGEDKNPHYSEGKKLLEDFKRNIGEDLLKSKIAKEEFSEKIKTQKEQDKKTKDKSSFLEKIKLEFYSKMLLVDKREIQKRGYWLEDRFYDVLELENIYCKKPYRTNFEQIDGHLKFDTFDYLVEVKWTKELIKQKEISEFEGKIDGKAQSTRGIFFSINGFEESAINQVKKRNPRIFFIDVTDFISVLEERKTLFDIFTYREDRLTRLGKVYNE